MHYSLEGLDWTFNPDGWARAVAVLDENDTLENPASTKQPIYGPGVFKINQYKDGGIDVIRP